MLSSIFDFLEDTTKNNFVLEMSLYFLSNGSDWERGKKLGDGKLKLSRNDLQILVRGFCHTHYGILKVSRRDLRMSAGV